MIRALATAAVVLAVTALARVGRAGFYRWCRGRYSTSQWCADRLTAAADRRWSRCVRLVPPGTDMHIASEGRARSIRFIPYSAEDDPKVQPR